MFLSVALLPACPCTARSTQSTGDSTRLFRYDEVVVRAERYPESPEKAGASSYEVNRDPSWEFGGPGASLAAGRNIHLASYGGGAALQTVSIRGMGAEHTLLLWNGMPAGNMQTGISDLNLFPAADLDVIRVVPGGATAMYGSAAVGGVINMVPVRATDVGPSIEAGGMAGSFGMSGMFARARIRPMEKAGVALRASSARANGAFPFRDPATGMESVREGADYLTRSVSLNAGMDAGDVGRFDLIASGLALDQGAPGPWRPAAPAPDARRNDRRLIAGLWYERPGQLPPITAGAMVDLQYERFLDPSGAGAADNHYRTTWAGASVQFRHRAGPSLILLAGPDAKYERSAGNAIDSTRERFGGAFAATASWMLLTGEQTEATLTPSIRMEGTSGFEPRYSPRIGLNVVLRSGDASVRFHGAGAASSRNPTMNELWYGGEGGRGNPGLRGEESVSIEGGAGLTIPVAGVITLDGTWYGIGMTDRILWLPTENPRVWSPRNIGKTRSTGWEFCGRWNVSPGALEMWFDYSIIDSKRGDITDEGTTAYEKQLTYVPLDKGSVGIVLGRTESGDWWNGYRLDAVLVYTGPRYTTSDNSSSLPSNAVLEGGVTLKFRVPGGTASVRYAAGNIGSLDYEQMPGYPMPGFHHSLTIIWKIDG